MRVFVFVCACVCWCVQGLRRVVGSGRGAVDWCERGVEVNGVWERFDDWLLGGVRRFRGLLSLPGVAMEIGERTIGCACWRGLGVWICMWLESFLWTIIQLSKIWGNFGQFLGVLKESVVRLWL